MLKLTAHFFLEELTASDTAARLGLTEQFSPPPMIIENLKRLANALESVRALLGGHPVLVSSGYRCKRLNDATPGSSKVSSHLDGLAADFTVPRFGTPLDVCQRLVAMPHFEFDQVIYEYGRWCHLGIGYQMRREALSKFTDAPYKIGLVETPSSQV